MSIHPSARLFQLAVTSLGYDAGGADGWWGKNTQAAGLELYARGPIKSSEWAVETLGRALAGLGYFRGGISGVLTPALRTALGLALDNEGAPFASVADEAKVLKPTKPVLRDVTHGKVLRQGSAGYPIEGLCLHCLAVPGDWWRHKTNAEIVAAIRHMHSAPKAQGGRGWSDIGYHAIVCPDGEVMTGRPVSRIGAGAVGYNRGWFHMVMVEVRTIDKTRLPEDHFSPATLASAKTQIERVANLTPIKRLMGHREVAAKLCPGSEIIDRDWTGRSVA